MRSPVLLALASATVLTTGCGGTRYMEPGARLAAPPEGKALVNVHRPSTAYGGGQDLVVWDGDQVIGNTHGKDMFQYVCEPGHHVFHAKQMNVSVITADLAAGKTYDIVSDSGPNFVPFEPNYRLWLNPVGADRAAQVPTWLAKETTLVLSSKDEKARHDYERKNLSDVHKYVADFTTGDKKDKAAAIPESAGH
jgi:hypothetical protein